MQNSEEIILNWENSLTNNYDKRFLYACAECEEHKENGLSRSEANEILLSKGHSLNSAEVVLEKIYGKKYVAAAADKFYVVPTSYEDVKGIVEKTLFEAGPEVLSQYLLDAIDPIMKVTAKYKQEFRKFAAATHQNPSTIDFLHEEIKPFMEESMLNSILLAQSSNHCQIKNIKSSQYSVNLNGNEAIVDLASGKSSGSRFTRGNFDKFGLADEYIVKAHDECSPFVRLRKDLF